ncbi:hypothetical protein [Winogradskyella undariae]|uniref:hypothetical protein n=1 Tax=Winogradskyella undariae TaxID=1285465 RepID=UPI0015C86C9D|nr:hypothetical protein [Winogradskyella undariae]QNK78901.1 hypothetical protein H7F37_07470 [Winogradskyella sp. PAMC22761]
MSKKKSKKILFITFDLSGYYDCILDELKEQYSDVDFYNLANYRNVPYNNLAQRVKSFYYKKFKGLKLKNFYKYNPIIEEVKNNTYDTTLIVRPDLFFDSQLKILKENSSKLLAYYHDSINNIPRKKEVIHFFDKVYSYEKIDVKDYNLNFIPNFIYIKDYNKEDVINSSFFTIMSKDYRFYNLVKLANYLKNKPYDYNFLVHSDKPQPKHDTINFIQDRKNNNQVLEYINQSKIIVDIHKYGVQDGLTFRVFESLFFEKKLITSNSDIKNYDFYNPKNILVIEDFDNIDIPESFISEPYQKIPEAIYKKYHYSTWLKTVLGTF